MTPLITLDYKKVFLYSDPHFGHNNIIRFCKRPFKDKDEMDKELIRRYQETVSDEDMCIIHGDVSFKSQEHTLDILDQLPGDKIIILGNHDRVIEKLWKNRLLPKNVNIYKGILEIRYKNEISVHCHYPILEWDGYFRDRLHFHGHQHNTNNDFPKMGFLWKRYDVGVDANDFRPVELIKIREKLKKMKPVD